MCRFCMKLLYVYWYEIGITPTSKEWGHGFGRRRLLGNIIGSRFIMHFLALHVTALNWKVRIEVRTILCFLVSVHSTARPCR